MRKRKPRSQKIMSVDVLNQLAGYLLLSVDGEPAPPEANGEWYSFTGFTVWVDQARFYEIYNKLKQLRGQR